MENLYFYKVYIYTTTTPNFTEASLVGTKPDEVCANVIKAVKEPAKARSVEGNKL